MEKSIPSELVREIALYLDVLDIVSLRLVNSCNLELFSSKDLLNCLCTYHAYPINSTLKDCFLFENETLNYRLEQIADSKDNVLARRLIELGATSYNHTLETYLDNGNVEILKLLLSGKTLLYPLDGIKYGLLVNDLEAVRETILPNLKKESYLYLQLITDAIKHRNQPLVDLLMFSSLFSKDGISTVLLNAIEYHNMPLVYKCLELGARNTMSGFIIALAHGNVEVVQLFLSSGANFSDRALYHATSSDSIECVEIVLNSGARHSPEIFNDALRNAAERGNLEIFELLLLISTDSGPTCIVECAAKGGNFALFKRVIELFPCPELDLQNALRFAVDKGAIEIVKFLMERVSVQNIQSIMSAAVRCGYLGIVQLILTYDKNFNYDSLLTESAEGHNILVTSLIIKTGKLEFSREVRDEDENSIIEIAIFNDNLGMVKLLLKLGYPIRDGDINSAANLDHVEIVKVLLPHYTNVGSLALAIYSTTEGENVEMLTILLSRKDLITTEDLNFSLTEASQLGCYEIIKLLVDAGATDFAQPLQETNYVESPEIVELI